MSRRRRTENWILYAAAVLLCLTMLTTCMTGRLYARYSTSVSYSDGARVAMWGSSQSIVLASSDELPKVPGDTCSYTLLISNKNVNSQISEVAQQYSIEVVTEGNLPFTYILFQDGKQIGSFTETTQEKNWKVSDDRMVFQAGIADSHAYTLEVTWPVNQNSAVLAGVPDFIQINICAEQMD